MHLSETDVKLYAFLYNNSSIKPQQGGLIVALMRTPLLADPADKYAEMSRRKHPFKLLHKLHNCMSVKSTPFHVDAHGSAVAGAIPPK